MTIRKCRGAAKILNRKQLSLIQVLISPASETFLCSSACMVLFQQLMSLYFNAYLIFRLILVTIIFLFCFHHHHHHHHHHML